MQVYVRVNRYPDGTYDTDVVGDGDALVGVSVTEHSSGYGDPNDEAETVYLNDAAIDMWEDYHHNGGPNPLTLGEDES